MVIIGIIENIRLIFDTIRFVDVIEFFGTFAFAVSGIRLAAAKQFDLFGTLVIGFVTAIGGGTLRDLFLGIVPFWMRMPIYIWTTLASLLFVAVFQKQLVRLKNTMFLFDSIGLGLFVVVGVEKTLSFGFEPWVAVAMGTITGSFGGMMRDVLINEIPLIFRREIYALACIIGGVVFTILYALNVSMVINELLTATIVIVIRILSVRFRWHLPILKVNTKQ